MELNFIWCLFLSKSKLGPICTGTCFRTYFRQFVVSFKNPNLCSLLPGAGAGSGLKIPGAGVGAVPKQAGSETLQWSDWKVIPFTELAYPRLAGE